MFAQGRRQNYIGVPSHAIGYCETKSVYPSGLVVLQLTFCFVEHHDCFALSLLAACNQVRYKQFHSCYEVHEVN